jgi:hypothetical protein
MPYIRNHFAGLLAVAVALSLAPGVSRFVRAAEISTAAPGIRPSPGLTNAPIREIRPGILELGSIRLYRDRKSITFPAFLNMNEGIVEYLLVANSGKTHESVLRTEVDPYQIHVAMLLLGARGAGTNSFPDDPAQPTPGDLIDIEAAWTLQSQEHRRHGEDLVHNRKTLQPLARGPWVYNGSRIVEGSFVAQLEGSIVSVITDPNALANNPRPGHEDDELWMVCSNGLPDLETPVMVTLHLLETNGLPRSGPAPAPKQSKPLPSPSPN